MRAWQLWCQDQPALHPPLPTWKSLCLFSDRRAASLSTCYTHYLEAEGSKEEVLGCRQLGLRAVSLKGEQGPRRCSLVVSLGSRPGRRPISLTQPPLHGLLQHKPPNWDSGNAKPNTHCHGSCSCGDGRNAAPSSATDPSPGTLPRRGLDTAGAQPFLIHSPTPGLQLPRAASAGRAGWTPRCPASQALNPRGRSSRWESLRQQLQRRTFPKLTTVWASSAEAAPPRRGGTRSFRHRFQARQRCACPGAELE